MKYPLGDCIVAVTGNFREPRNPKNLERWVVNNGGKFSNTINKDVTHLICTWDDWDKKAQKGEAFFPYHQRLITENQCILSVKQAMDLGTIDIVTYDWLEDSIMTKRPKSERRYLLSAVEKGRRKKARKEKKKVNAGEFHVEKTSIQKHSQMHPMN